MVARDVVSRSVEQFADDSLTGNSIEFADSEFSDQRAPEHRSLVHGPFLKFARKHLAPMSRDEFGDLWRRAAGKP